MKKICQKLIFMGWFCVSGFMVGSVWSEGDSSAVTPLPASTPFDVSKIPVSVFTVSEGRDPFTPVGWKKKEPPKPGDPAPKPVVTLKLVVVGISTLGESAVATLDDGRLVEVGESYSINGSDGKMIGSYKVLRITDDRIVVTSDGKNYEFKLKSSDLDKFIEKN